MESAAGGPSLPGLIPLGSPSEPAAQAGLTPTLEQAEGSARYCPETPASGVVLPVRTAGIRVEGAGTVHWDAVTVSYQHAPGERRLTAASYLPGVSRNPLTLPAWTKARLVG